jgi:osmotically inducible lipoprotein OsmB
MRGRILALALALGASGLTGCAVDQTTGERTLSAAAAGAAGGGVIGLIRGDFFGSALTGAAAGAASGFVYDQLRR